MTVHQKNKERLARALILSGPAAGALIGFVYGVLYLLFDHENQPAMFPALWVTLILGGAVSGFVLGLPIALVVGLPAHAFLMRKRWVSSAAYVLTGAAVGLLVAIAGALLASNEILFYRLTTGVIFGIGPPIAAYIAWLIRRPDRDEPSAHMPQAPAA